MDRQTFYRNRRTDLTEPLSVVRVVAATRTWAGPMAALRHGDQSGEGQHVDVALVDALLFQSNGLPTVGALDLPMSKWGNEFSRSSPVNVYSCNDGDVFCGVLLDAHWARLCDLLQRHDLAHLKMSERSEKRTLLNGLLAEFCAQHTTVDVVDAFTELGLAATRVNTYKEVSQHEHVASRDMPQAIQLSDGKEVPLTGPATTFSRTPTKICSASPPLGAHAQQVLTGLGYTEEQVAEIVACGAIATGIA
jgi:formyl-CoA transferase